MRTIPILNNESINIFGFQDEDTGEYLNAASLATWELRTAISATGTPSGTQLATGTLQYVTGSDGCYVGLIPGTISLTPGTIYYLFVVLEQGANRGYWPEPVQAVMRSGADLTT